MAAETRDLNQAVLPGLWADVALLLNRLALGAFFLFAGVAKLRMGVGEFYVKGFSGLRPPWLPEAFAWPFGHALPFVEAIAGALLILGLVGRATAGLLTLLLLSFCVALQAAGMFFSGPGPFHTNVLFLTLAFLLAVLGPGRISLDHLICRKGVVHSTSAPNTAPAA